MSDEQDATDPQTAYDDTLERYELAFGEPTSEA
jgi:hypothetical protein